MYWLSPLNRFSVESAKASPQTRFFIAGIASDEIAWLTEALPHRSALKPPGRLPPKKPATVAKIASVAA